MSSNLANLPLSSTFTVEQALAAAARDNANVPLKRAIVVGEYDDGQLYTTSSRMSRSDALWLSEKLRLYALNA